MRTLKCTSFGLSKADNERLDIIVKIEGISSRSEALRRMIDRAYREVLNAPA